MKLEKEGIRVGSTEFDIERFTVKQGEKIKLHTFDRQQGLLLGIYQEFLPKLTAENFSQLKASLPDHPVFKFAELFEPKPDEDPDVITPRMIKSAESFIQHQIERSPENPQWKIAQFLLEQLAKVEESDTVSVLGQVGAGGLGIVVRAIKQDRPGSNLAEPHLEDANLYKILFNIKGSHDQIDKAMHVVKVAQALKGTPYPISSSLALPRYPFEAEITHLNGEKTSTVVFELKEAPPGIEFSDWQPHNVDEFIAVVEQMNKVIKYLHEKEIYNPDTSDPFISVERLERHLKSAKDDDMSFVTFYDLDESVLALDPNKVEYPFVFNPRKNYSFTGKASDFNSILHMRNSERELDVKVAEFAEMHIFISSIFRKLINGKGIDQIAPVKPEDGGCYFSLFPNFTPEEFGFAVANFTQKESYPLIDFETFKKKLIFELSDEDARTIYDHFKYFFDKYLEATKLTANDEPIPASKDNFLGRIDLILAILRNKKPRLKMIPQLVSRQPDLSDKSTQVSTRVPNISDITEVATPAAGD